MYIMNETCTKLLILSMVIFTVVSLVSSAIPLVFGEQAHYRNFITDDEIRVHDFGFICEDGSYANLLIRIWPDGITHASLTHVEENGDERNYMSSWLDTEEEIIHFDKVIFPEVYERYSSC